MDACSLQSFVWGIKLELYEEHSYIYFHINQ